MGIAVAMATIVIIFFIVISYFHLSICLFAFSIISLFSGLSSNRSERVRNSFRYDLAVIRIFLNHSVAPKLKVLSLSQRLVGKK